MCASGRINWNLLVAFLQFRQAKVEKLHAVACQHDVAGLDISVHHAVSMRVVKRIGDPDGGTQGEGKRQRAILEPPREGVALDILHDEEDRRTVLTDVVQCADIRMRDACDDASFVAEPFDPGTWRGHQFARQNLEGDSPLEPRIAGTVDFAHSPGAEWCQDLERAETSAGCEPHRMGRREAV